MTKKSNAAKKKTAAPAANANTPAPKKGQTKIPGTGRLDADDEIEAQAAQAEKVRKKTEARMALEIEERSERSLLTEMLKEKKRAEYIYEDDDGEMRRAYIPKSEKEPQAKVQKLKKVQAEVD